MSSSAETKFPITAAQLSANFVETLFYGMYLITCGFVARTLLLTGRGREERWLRPREIRWMMLGIALVLFVICSFDVVIGLVHNFEAFVGAGSAKKEFDDTTNWINLARSVNQVITILLGDFVLIYRCWVVHGRRWLVVVPSIVLFLGGIAMAIIVIAVVANPSSQQTILSRTQPWGLALLAITAAQNILTTSILIWRIWRVESQSSKYLDRIGSPATLAHQPSHLRKVIRVIAESGAAYTMMVFIMFIVGLSDRNALYPTSNITLQGIGIAFNVILIRSSVRRDEEFTDFDRGRGVQSTTTSIHFERGQSGSLQDVELNASNVDETPKSDIYPDGITVTRTVITS